MGLFLNLGCGYTARENYVNVDIMDLEHVDQVVDLNELPWPWKENSVEEIFSSDCFEHLFPLGKQEGQMNIVAILRECFRVLEPGGILNVSVPSTDGRGAFQDPTHVTFWNQNTFLYFVKGTKHSKVNHFGVEFELLESRLYGTKEDMVVWAQVKLQKSLL